MTKLQVIFVAIIVLPICYVLYDWLDKYKVFGSTKKRYMYRGTNRQSHNFKLHEDLENLFGAKIPSTLVEALQRAGTNSIGEFLLQIIAVIVIVAIIVAVNLWFFPEFWWASIFALFLLVLPPLQVISKLIEHERDFIKQAQLFASTISVEYSRHNDWEVSFRAAVNATTGWTQEVFSRMVNYMDSVKGDVDGALEIFKKLHKHTLADQFVMCVKQGNELSKVKNNLINMKKSAMRAKKELDIKQSKKNDAVIFMAAMSLFLVLGGAAAYYLFYDSTMFDYLT